MSELAAYHEAGHAFMAIYVGARVRSISIDPAWDDGPLREADIQVEWPARQFSQRQLREFAVCVALAGPVAEMIHTGEPYHPGFIAAWAADWEAAWQDASRLFTTERETLAYLEQRVAQLYRLLYRDEHWAALAAIVDELLAHETLAGEQVHATYRQWMGGSPRR